MKGVLNRHENVWFMPTHILSEQQASNRASLHNRARNEGQPEARRLCLSPPARRPSQEIFAGADGISAGKYLAWCTPLTFCALVQARAIYPAPSSQSFLLSALCSHPQYHRPRTRSALATQRFSTLHLQKGIDHSVYCCCSTVRSPSCPLSSVLSVCVFAPPAVQVGHHAAW